MTNRVDTMKSQNQLAESDLRCDLTSPDPQRVELSSIEIPVLRRRSLTQRKWATFISPWMFNVAHCANGGPQTVERPRAFVAELMRGTRS